MSPGGDHGVAERAVEVFISYSPADEMWATWIAWQLEVAGCRTLLQVWDIQRGTSVVDVVEFTERAMRVASVTVAVLSRAYLASPRLAPERRIALRTDVSRLVTVRVEDCPPDGVPTGAAHLDLAHVWDPRAAERMLLARIEPVLAAHTGSAGTGLAGQAGPPDHGAGLGGPAHRAFPDARAARRRPTTPPPYPPAFRAACAEKTDVSVLHVPGPRFGRGLVGPDEPTSPLDRQHRIQANISRLTDAGVPAPDLIVVTGDLTETARPRQMDDAWTFLTGLRVALGLPAGRLIVVPGARDVSTLACEAHFRGCEDEDTVPEPPYFPKLARYSALFADLYHGLEQPQFDGIQPYTLFEVPELRVVCAALNSTWAITHQPEDNYGQIGYGQATWFADQLREYARRGWLRLGVVRHDPLPGSMGAEEPDVLRDADTLANLLGNRLNLLLHGPGQGAEKVLPLGSAGMQVVPGVPGRDEITHVTEAGLRLYSVYDDRHHHGQDKPDPPFGFEEVRTPWRDAAATFTARPARLLSAPDAAEVPALQAADNAHLRLLERIADVCAHRWPDAWITPRRSTDPPQIMVTHRQDDREVQQRIGAYAGKLTVGVVENFLRHDPFPGAELVYQGPPPDEEPRRMARRRAAQLRSFTEFQGVLDLSQYVIRQTARLHADRTYPPTLYVPQRFRELGRDGPPRSGLVEELIELVSADEGCFVLVLGDFGRGKSFALREVARQLGESSSPQTPTPILIDLAALDRSMSVRSLVAAHLTDHGEEEVRNTALRYLLDEGRVVLLFDGFDELVSRTSYDRAGDHLETLLQAAEGKAKIVVASRTQHFRSHDQVLRAMGERVRTLTNRRILTVEEFTPAQVHHYLTNRHGDEERARRQYDLLRGAGDLLGLAHNPRMLSFIAELDDAQVSAVARNRHTISPAGLYGQVLDSWMAHEAARATAGHSGNPPMDPATMRSALTALALRLWETGEPYLRPGELAEVTGALTGLVAEQLSEDEREHAVGSGSLLVRTDNGLFGFIHPSVVEWLVAKAIAAELHTGLNTGLNAGSDTGLDAASGSGLEAGSNSGLDAGSGAARLLSRQRLSQLSVDFLCDIADPSACRAWAASVASDARAGSVSRHNAEKIRTRLSTPRDADLRGCDLRGQDLSHRDFTEIDLTGADLTGADLRGATLTGASLRDATLVGVRLDEATLISTDLSGADLRRARLSRTDLTGATVSERTRWTRAALIDAPGLSGGPPKGAAVAPGSSAVPELAPSSIGVRHSFDPAMDGLPQIVAYSPDGDLLAIGSEEGGLLVCDSLSGRPVRTLKGHRGRVCTVAYGGEVLVSGANDGTIRIWDTATGRPERALEGHVDGPWPVLVDPAGTRVVTGDGEGTLRLWDSDGDAPRLRIASDAGGIVSMALHGSLLAAAYRAGGVRLWDIEDGSERRLPGGSVTRLAFDATGELLFVAGNQGQLRAWHPCTGQLVHELAGHCAAIHALAVHPSKPMLVAGDVGGAVRLWTFGTETGSRDLVKCGAAVYAVAFSPSGELVAAGDRAGAVRVWDASSDSPPTDLVGHTGSVWPFAFRPDGKQLAISDDQRTTRLWDPITGECRHTLSGHGRRLTSVRFSADGSLLTTSGNDGRVRLWNTANVSQQRLLTASGDQLMHLAAAIFSPAGPQLAMVGADGRLSVFNTQTGGYERHLQVPSEFIWAIAFSASGTELATANDDDTVGVWDHQTGRLLGTLAEHKGRVRSIAYSPDGSMIATACDDCQVRLWDASSYTLLKTLSGHTARVYAVSFGRGTLASASWDGTAMLWDLHSDERLPLTRHVGRLWATAFHPSGQLLATAGDDTVIRLWNRSGDYLQSLTGHTRAVSSLMFNPTGDLLASAGEDGTARLWTIPADAGDGEATRRGTLLGLPLGGWAALAPDGRYKTDGTVQGEFWHVIGTCRFEIGELDGLLTEIRHVPAADPM